MLVGQKVRLAQENNDVNIDVTSNYFLDNSCEGSGNLHEYPTCKKDRMLLAGYINSNGEIAYYKTDNKSYIIIGKNDSLGNTKIKTSLDERIHDNMHCGYCNDDNVKYLIDPITKKDNEELAGVMIGKIKFIIWPKNKVKILTPEEVSDIPNDKVVYARLEDEVLMQGNYIKPFGEEYLWKQLLKSMGYNRLDVESRFRKRIGIVCLAIATIYYVQKGYLKILVSEKEQITRNAVLYGLTFLLTMHKYDIDWDNGDKEMELLHGYIFKDKSVVNEENTYSKKLVVTNLHQHITVAIPSQEENDNTLVLHSFFGRNIQYNAKDTNQNREKKYTPIYSPPKKTDASRQDTVFSQKSTNVKDIKKFSASNADNNAKDVFSTRNSKVNNNQLPIVNKIKYIKIDQSIFDNDSN